MRLAINRRDSCRVRETQAICAIWLVRIAIGNATTVAVTDVRFSTVADTPIMRVQTGDFVAGYFIRESWKMLHGNIIAL
jgi:hypothetical protein